MAIKASNAQRHAEGNPLKRQLIRSMRHQDNVDILPYPNGKLEPILILAGLPGSV
jgi:hypothetical protein